MGAMHSEKAIVANLSTTGPFVLKILTGWVLRNYVSEKAAVGYEKELQLGEQLSKPTHKAIELMYALRKCLTIVLTCVIYSCQCFGAESYQARIEGAQDLL